MRTVSFCILGVQFCLSAGLLMLAGCSGEGETVYHEYEPEAETVASASDSATAEPDSLNNRDTVSPADDASTSGSEPHSEQPQGLASEADPSDSAAMPSPSEEAGAAPKGNGSGGDTSAAAAGAKPSSPGTESGNAVSESNVSENTASRKSGAEKAASENRGSKGPDSPMLARAEIRNPADPRRLAQDPSEPVEPREPKLLIPDKEFRAEGAGKALRVTFDDIDLLKVLNMEPVPEDAVSQFPEWLEQLEGKRVRIRGFMFPTLSQTGITYFQHVRDNEICCFGRTPKVYDRISTVLREGETTNYIQGRPFDVVGTFRIDPVYEDGEWLQLYLLEDAIVFP